MPTGGGKSLCYQLPALLLEGTTVVVSPLIALMKDQVDALQRRGISATLINSSLSLDEQRERIRSLARGEFKLVYIAPERFRSRSFLDALGQSTIALFAVDEAHCLSMLGDDFRPDYFRLGQVLETLGRPQVAAFTATATPEVRRDILTHLALREPREFVAGFARPNLKLLITHVANEAQKYERLNALIRDHKTGIVYCSTRKRVEAVAETLRLAKISSILYHGGMNDEEREKAQNEFMQGRRDVVVATNAFGMGIDRPDIRFVVHFDVPGSVEAYYQEAGRAGRDGEAATCDLLFNHADTRVQAAGDPALFWRKRSGALRELRHLSRDGRAGAAADRAGSAHCAESIERRGAHVCTDRWGMAGTVWPWADRAGAGRQPFAGNHQRAARSAFDLWIAKERRGRLSEPASARAAGHRHPGFERRAISDGDVDPER